MILESQHRLDDAFPQENPETCLVAVKQEIAFIDEASVLVKLEPLEEETTVIATSIVDSANGEYTGKKRGRKKRGTRETTRKSSRSGINRSYDESPERVAESGENLARKRGRPRKSTVQLKELAKDEEVLKLEVKEGSRESSPAGFNDANSSDDDFKPSKDEFDEIPPEAKKPKVPEIFATCDICPKTKKIRLQDADDVKIHNEYVHEDPAIPFNGPFKCKSCPKVISSEVKIRKHVRLFHIFGNEKLCTTCGKKFYDRRAFYCHIDKNHGIRVS
jgi:hypothetical protein